MTEKIISMIKNGEVPLKYRDPQEMILGDERTPESDVYSYGMMIFEMICGKSYFEYSGIPEDECFMMADTESSDSVPDEKYIPDEVKFIFPIIQKMTVYRRNARADISSVLESLEEILSAENSSIQENIETPVSENISDDIEKVSEEKTEDADSPYKIISEYDYGVILNNKRSGRIEFKVILDYEGNIKPCDIPVYESGIFSIAVSRRHCSNAHISNPSSVYGDCIIPVGIAKVQGVREGKIKISAENINGEIALYITENDLKTKAEWRNGGC